MTTDDIKTSIENTLKKHFSDKITISSPQDDIIRVDIERENLKGYLMLLFKKGPVEKGRINPSDYRKLEEMNLVFVGEDEMVYPRDKANHICRTVYS